MHSGSAVRIVNKPMGDCSGLYRGSTILLHTQQIIKNNIRSTEINE